MEENNILEGNFTEIDGAATAQEAPAQIPFMSVIIPAYNCRNEIEKLLYSIVAQNWSKDKLEVIICDDNSTDGFMELVEPFYEQLNIKYFKTEPRDIHCPGNTRKDGLSHATGEWVTFIDNDDVFDNGAFDMIENHIKTTGETRMVFTIFHEWIDKKWVQEGTKWGYGRDFDGNTWLHGNWYNRAWLKKFNIDFKENLESHEDLYFNSMCTTALLSEGVSYSIPAENLNTENRKYAYTWVYRPNSLSRSYFSETHYYIEVYLRDYIYSATEPWLYGYRLYCQNGQNPELREFFIKQCVATILYTFFYWEAGYYRIGEQVLPENIPIIKDAVEQICFRFKITRTEIIQRVYARPDEYMRIKQESFSGGGSFVELHTFKDFIMSL